MSFDEQLDRKMDAECARQDNQAFRLRVRAIRLVTERALAAVAHSIDVNDVAGNLVAASDSEVLATLQKALGADRLDHTTFRTLFAEAHEAARRELARA